MKKVISTGSCPEFQHLWETSYQRQSGSSPDSTHQIEEDSPTRAPDMHTQNLKVTYPQDQVQRGLGGGLGICAKGQTRILVQSSLL